jgi:hypothetical protein
MKNVFLLSLASLVQIQIRKPLTPAEGGCEAVEMLAAAESYASGYGTRGKHWCSLSELPERKTAEL